MSGLATVTLRVTTPCCRRPVRLTALVDVPVQVYERTCAGCGRRWTVERRDHAASRPGVRIDVTEWTTPGVVEERRRGAGR